MMCASSKEAETDVTFLTDSEEGRIILTADQDTPLMAGTRSGQ